MSKINKTQLDKPLTLEMLIEYNRKTFLPESEKRFVTKNEFNNFDKLVNKKLILLENKLNELRDEGNENQNKNLTRLDKILKNIETLHEEKEVMSSTPFLDKLSIALGFVNC